MDDGARQLSSSTRGIEDIRRVADGAARLLGCRHPQQERGGTHLTGGMFSGEGGEAADFAG